MNSNTYKYAVLTFVFNNYDLVRTPDLFVDDVEYILVSDHYFDHPVWTVVVDKDLADKDPIYQSYYVRYHPFKYVHSDVCIVLDGSIKIRSDLSGIVDSFNSNNRDMMVMCSNYWTADQKIEYWRTIRNIDATTISNIKQLQTELHANDLLGGICNAFKICRNNEPTRNFHIVTWQYLMVCGINNNPNRLDEIVAHIILRTFFMYLKLDIVSTQIMHSNLLTRYKHATEDETDSLSDYDDFYYLCNIPVTPKRFGDEHTYPTSYKYKTEAILLTKYLNEADLDEWLDWHLNKCGFEHIQVFANDLPFDIEQYAKKYNDDRVSFTAVHGIVRQYKIYNDYVNTQSQAKWIMPIDDDEYLSFSDEFTTIYDVIRYYEQKFPHLNMLAVRWKHMFPKQFHIERTGKVLDYCTEENKELAVTFNASGDRMIKTIVKRYGKIYYEETCERKYGGHVPKHSSTYAATAFDGTRVISTARHEYPVDTTDEKIRLLHCRYTGPQEWKSKYGNDDQSKNCVRISDVTHKQKYFIFTKLLPYLD